MVTEGIDWAAYMGGADDTLPREFAEKFVAETGDKISEKLARVIFPDIKLPYRR